MKISKAELQQAKEECITDSFRRPWGVQETADLQYLLDNGIDNSRIIYKRFGKKCFPTRNVGGIRNKVAILQGGSR